MPVTDPSRSARPLLTRVRRLLAAALLTTLLPGLGAASDALERCRDLRQSEPRLGAEACEEAARALAAANQADQAFEAWMHASELASQLGEPERAEAALVSAVALLAQVDDPLAAQRLARRRGLNAYRAGQPVEALGHFLEALSAARAAGDEGARAISENDLGVTYRHLGNYEAALSAFESSLALRERSGESNLGALLANIGSLYLELGDHSRAEDYLQRALQDHRSAGRSLPAERTREQLALLAQRQGRHSDSDALLEEIWTAYTLAQSPRDMQRVALLRARHALETHDVDTAAQWLTRAREVPAGADTENLQTAVLAAALADDEVERERSQAELSAALADGQGHAPQQRLEALEALARLSEAMGQPAQAAQHLRQLHTEAMALAEARHGERFDGLRVRFDMERLEAEAARRETELAQRRFETASVAAVGLLALALLGLWSQRRVYRQRLTADRERLTMERRIAEARKAASELRSDLRSMAWLLERQQSACLVFDAAGRIRAATADAAQMLGYEPSALQGMRLDQALDAGTAQWAQALVENAALAGDGGDHVDLGSRDLDLPLAARARCQHLDMEEELGVLHFESAIGGVDSTLPTPQRTQQPGDAPATAAPEDAAALHSGEERRQEFRRLLVRLMRTALEAWERASRKGRVELAESSGIWRITIDDGRLRVRAMDRYLSLDTLPERPRWREVLRTAYFLLGEVAISSEHRSQLEALAEELLRHTRPQI
jgi:two-component system, sensor histidine kinase ChiS